MHLAQELLMNIQCSGGSGSFAKKTRTLKMRSAVAGTGSWQPPTERIIKNDPLSTTRVKELNVAHSMVAQHFKQIGKVKKLSEWVPHELTEIKKIVVLKHRLLILCNNNEPLLHHIMMCNKKWAVYKNWWGPAQWLDQKEAPKHFPKSNLHQKKVMVTDQPRQHIKKQRHYFANKGPSSQGYGFSSGHVWMWELDYKESWVPKNWCFWTVVLEKTLESPLDCKEIQPVHSKGDQSWVFFGRNDAKAETPVLWPPHVKNWLIGKDSDSRRDCGQEEKGTTENEMAGWHHQLDGRESGWTLGVGDGQGGVACCNSWGLTRLNDWTELNSCHYMHSDLHFPKAFFPIQPVIYILGVKLWHPTPVLLPGKSHGRRSLVGCSPWGH